MGYCISIVFHGFAADHMIFRGCFPNRMTDHDYSMGGKISNRGLWPTEVAGVLPNKLLRNGACGLDYTVLFCEAPNVCHWS